MRDTEHFTSSEFACPCCGLVAISQPTVDKLEVARGIAGIPFSINSGTRCEKHNKEIGGAEQSPHVPWLGESYAADINALHSRERFKILKALILAGFNRIGIGANFIHADDAPLLDRDVVWTYYNK